MTLTDSNDIWSISFQGTGYNYHGYDASATIDMAAGLKAIDIELPISLTASIGTAGQYENYVYADPNSMVDNYYELVLATSSDRQFAFSAGYNGWIATVAVGI